MPRTTAAKTREVLVVHEGGDEKDSPTKGIPLFQGGGDDEITIISVFRTEPIEEGTVGTVPPDADEEMIRSKFGGGTYRISAKGTDGKIKGARTIIISGDPKFDSLHARRKYKLKMTGLADDDDRPPPPAPPPPPPSMAIPEILALVSQSHAQQMEMMRLQMAAAKIEADDRERRNRIEADEREARARREAEESRERDRAFNATMLTLVKSDAKTAATSPLEMVTVLMQGLKLGRQMGDGGGDSGPSDPITALIANLPGILERGASLVQAGAAQPPGHAPAVPPGSITLSGPVVGKLKVAVQGLMGKGYSQEQALAIADSALAAGVDAMATIPNAPQRSEPQPAAAAPPPARKATPIRARATPKR